MSDYKSFDISRTLLIEGVICCKLKQFILAVSNSTVWAILLLWFQREDSAEINRRKVLTSCRTCLMTISECLVPHSALKTCVIWIIFKFKRILVSIEQLATNMTLCWFHVIETKCFFCFAFKEELPLGKLTFFTYIIFQKQNKI